MLLNDLEIKYFREITQLNAVSGNESEVADYLIKEYKKLNLELVKDNLGSLYALKKSKVENPLKVVIDAHMDEVGFIVKEIKSNGMIEPYPIGGINYNTVLATRLNLKSSKGRYFKGTFDSTPPHLMKDPTAGVDPNSLLCDFGFLSREDALNNGVNYGDMIALEGKFEFLNENRILSKAIDDRYGIILGLIILNELKDVELPYDLYVGGSVQEEVGLRGIQTINEVIKPDFIFVLDCSTAKDSYNLNEKGHIGEGVLLRFIDRGMIANKALIEFQKEACIATNSKYQYFETLGGTNAGAIHLKNVMTLTHCICARSIHTSSTIMDVNDYVSAKNSLKYMLLNLSRDKFNEFKESKY